MNDAIVTTKGGIKSGLATNWAMYADAVDRFTRCVGAFMEHLHLLTDARNAYQEAMAASLALHSTLEAGDQTLESLRAELERLVNPEQPKTAGKKPELPESTGSMRVFP